MNIAFYFAQDVKLTQQLLSDILCPEIISSPVYPCCDSRSGFLKEGWKVKGGQIFDSVNETAERLFCRRILCSPSEGQRLDVRDLGLFIQLEASYGQ